MTRARRCRSAGIDGAAHSAWCTRTDADGKTSQMETGFDMIHVVTPQTAPGLLRGFAPADAAWWTDVDKANPRMLPMMHWTAMLRGREWLATPEPVG